MDFLKIIAQALRYIFMAPGQTLRLSLVPVILIAVGVALLFTVAASAGPIATKLAVAAAIALYILAFLHLAVNFHRRALLGERFGWFPRVYWREMGGYLLQAIPMMLVLGLIALALAISLYLFFHIFGKEVWYPRTAWILELAANVAVGMMALRFFTVLPAIAISQPTHGVSAAMRRRWGTLAIIALAILLAEMAVATMSARLFFALPGAPLALWGVYSILGAWVGTLFGISILTALYEHYVWKHRQN